MKQKSVGFKVGVVLAAVHLCLAVLAFISYVGSSSSTAGLVFVRFFSLDAPILLLPYPIFKLFGEAAPLIQFGVLGSAMWFLIPWLMDRAITLLFPNGKWIVRVIIIAGAIPVILAGFDRLSSFSMKLMTQRERPAELKKVLNHASSNFLTEKVIFEDNACGTVRSISRMSCRGGDGTELIVAMGGGIAFLNESYQEQGRLNFSGRRFRTIEPLNTDDSNSCRFIAYRYGEGIYLLDAGGKEIWSCIQHDEDAGAADGLCFGDIDGDGKQEFAVYYPYGQGIHLLNSEGRMKWEHPVYGIEHVEIADVFGDGKARISYSDSNDAKGITDFTILDSEGTAASEQKIATESYEFAVIRWPNREARPNILLTEDNKIRIVDMKGETVMQLGAPGCRISRDMKAVTVKFKKDEAEYLAVRKSLFPDLLVLYVYDANGKLVYQKTDAVEGLPYPVIAAIPINGTGTEKLLVGSSAKNFSARVFEYSLTP